MHRSRAPAIYYHLTIVIMGIIIITDNSIILIISNIVSEQCE